ncbi:hypothetical protein [Blastopirellula retiformator]|uniref:Uncharacterized protein n=1 Tax=Blastopirellula retiformator TaxID=2527970 RepID=A0A5C5VN32_9BACT|nr:hypothetical protein [Blastopirellula retiformator]TWT39433.1 hypothetical protein Enr8_11320 [Blastopirellula retiformator]
MNDWLDYRYPRGGIAFTAGIFMLAGAVLFVVGDTWFTKYVCPFFLPLGMGLWLKHAWARWTAFTLLAATSVLAVVVLLFDFTTVRTLKLVTSLFMLYELWEWNVYPESEQFGFRMPDDEDDVALNEE